jgi:hypothetical protein
MSQTPEKRLKLDISELYIKMQELEKENARIRRANAIIRFEQFYDRCVHDQALQAQAHDQQRPRSLPKAFRKLTFDEEF